MGGRVEREVPARLVALACAALAGVLFATDPVVAQVGPAGFLAQHTVTINGQPDRVYDVLTKQVGSWWSSDHTYSGDAKNMSIDLRPGGCFCETIPGGGFIEHARVVYAMPRSALRVLGALGPLQEMGVAGSLTWTLNAAEAGTTVQMTYSVGGFVGGPFEAIAPVVQSVLAEQLERLKRFIETGRPGVVTPAKP